MKLGCLRGLACALLLAALLPAGARAEADAAEYWAGFFDYYYHAAPRCALAGTVSPVTLEEAQAQGKFACPACVDDETTYKGVDATTRGGTLVIRVSDAWLQQRSGEDLEADFEGYWAGEFTGTEAATQLAGLLHGAAYRAFLEAAGKSAAMDTALVPDVPLPEGGLLLNRRHIGAAWFLTMRPDAEGLKELEKKGRLYVDLGFNVNTLTMIGSALDVYVSGQWLNGGESTRIKPKESKNKTRFKLESDVLSLAVYKDMGINICVLHHRGFGAHPLDGATLRIDGVDQGLRLNGYDTGKDAIFCCVLTEAEALALEGGASVELSPRQDTAALLEEGFATAFSDALGTDEGQAPADG